MPDPLQRDPDSPEPFRAYESETYRGPRAGPVRVPERPRGSARTSTQELMDQLRGRWDDLKERVQKRMKEPAQSAGRTFARGFSENADYVKARARHYHEHRPLETLGVVAAAGFILGLLIGHRRR